MEDAGHQPPLEVWGSAVKVLDAIVGQGVGSGSTSSGSSGSASLGPVLLAGPRGSGKTAVVKRVAEKHGATVVALSVLLDVEADAHTAACRAPAVWLLDDLDVLFPAADGDGEPAELPPRGLDLVAALESRPGRVVTVACCEALSGVHPRLARCFQDQLALKIPTPDQRLAMFTAALGRHVSGLVAKHAAEAASRVAHAFVMGDVVAVVEAAVLASTGSLPHHNHDDENDENDADDDDDDGGEEETKAAAEPRVVVQPDRTAVTDALVTACTSHTPSVLRAAGLSHKLVKVSSPTASWDQVAGLEDVRRQLDEMVVLPRRHPEAFARMGATPPKGILLCGRPGVGKTMVARVVAAQAACHFLQVSIPDILRGTVGDSEKAIASMFRLAKLCSPSVLFFDEIQALFAARSEDSGHVERQLTSQLLLELSDLNSGATGTQVVVIAATNRPDLLDPSLLRPGRLDRLVSVPPPSAEVRLQALEKQLSKMPVDASVSATAIADATPDTTIADLLNVCRLAAVTALSRTPTGTDVVITNQDFDAALNTR